MKNIILFTSFLFLLTNSTVVLAQPNLKKQVLVGQKFSSQKPQPAVYKSSKPGQFKNRAISSSQAKKQQIIQKK